MTFQKGKSEDVQKILDVTQKPTEFYATMSLSEIDRLAAKNLRDLEVANAALARTSELGDRLYRIASIACDGDDEVEICNFDEAYFHYLRAARLSQACLTEFADDLDEENTSFLRSVIEKNVYTATQSSRTDGRNPDNWIASAKSASVICMQSIAKEIKQKKRKICTSNIRTKTCYIQNRFFSVDEPSIDRSRREACKKRPWIP
jgi:hypothetical protein